MAPLEELEDDDVDDDDDDAEEVDDDVEVLDDADDVEELALVLLLALDASARSVAVPSMVRPHAPIALAVAHATSTIVKTLPPTKAILSPPPTT